MFPYEFTKCKTKLNPKLSISQSIRPQTVRLNRL